MSQNSASAIPVKQPRFHQLDAIRGVAALAVVLSHFSSVMSSDPVANIDWLNKALGYFMLTPLGGLLIGLPAVLLFFVLSGFALTKMLQGSRDSYLGYAVKRVARIWPPYLLSIALSVFFIATLGWPTGEHVGGWVSKIIGHPLSSKDVIDHVLLLGAFDPHYNFVAWTLVYEMRISLLFPLIYMTLLRWGPKRTLYTYGAISFASVVLHYFAKSQGYLPLANWALTGHYALFFVVGGLIALHLAAIARWYSARSNMVRFFLLAVIIVSYTYPPQIRDLGGVFEKFPMVLTHWIILPSVALVVIMAITSPKVEAVLMHRTLQWLGKVSYSLYLFHPLVLFLMVFMLTDGFPILAAALLGVILSLLVAGVAYKWVELPSQRMGRTFGEFLKKRKPLVD